MTDGGELLFKYYLYVILAGVCWGLTGTLQALAPEGASSLSIGSVRMVAAGSILLIYSLARGGFSIFRQRWQWKGILITAIAQTAYQLSFFSAVRLAGVALGTIIAIGASPAMAGIIARVLYKERLGRRWVFSTAAAFAGCAMLIFGGAAGGIRVDFLGCLLAFVAAISYTFVGIGLREAGPADALQTTTLTFALAGLLSLPVLLSGETSWIASSHGLAIVLVLAAVSTIMPLMLFAVGVQKVPLGSAYTLSMTEPLTASLLAVFLLHERMPATSVFGALLMFFSIYVLTRPAK